MKAVKRSGNYLSLIVGLVDRVARMDNCSPDSTSPFFCVRDAFQVPRTYLLLESRFILSGASNPSPVFSSHLCCPLSDSYIVIYTYISPVSLHFYFHNTSGCARPHWSRYAIDENAWLSQEA